MPSIYKFVILKHRKNVKRVKTLKSKNKQDKKRRKKKGTGKKILLVLLFIILIIGAVFGYKVYKNGGGLKGFLATAIGHDQETVKNLPKMYCLLLGQSETLTDTIMVAEYDPQAQQASILSIPRDTFIGDSKATATASHKINAVYSYGGAEKTLKEVNELTGLDIKYYLKVDTKAFKKLVDEIGGVTFNVPIDMKYDDKRQNLHINLKAGEQLLDGDKAEQVVRFRHNNDGSTYPYEYGMEDIGRMKTQRNFLTALAKQTLKPENIFKINAFIDIAKENVETNLDFDTIKDYVPYIVEFNMANLQTQHLPGESAKINGWWFYEANEAKTAEIIDQFFLNPTQDDEVDTSSIDTSGIDKTKIKIELLNGSHSNAKLERIKKRLEKAGYTIAETREIADTENTVIIARGDIEEPIQEELKLLLDTKHISFAEKDKMNITLIIGKTEK